MSNRIVAVASNCLTSAALIGVTMCLVRQSRTMRERAVRDVNTALLKLAMEDPAYAECWRGNLPAGEPQEQRQGFYADLVLMQWEMGYETGAIGETHIRALAARLFEGRVPWEFWRRVRELRLETAESRRARRFQIMIDEEFQRVPEPPPRPESPKPRRSRPPSIRRRARRIRR